MASNSEVTSVPVRVRPQQGEAPGEKQTYFPVVRDFLRPGGNLPFNLYQRSAEEKLEIYLAKGSVLPRDFQAQVGAQGLENRLYIRGDNRVDLLEHEEAVLLDVLDDRNLPIERKCRAMQDLTQALSQQIHENPSSTNIRRQQRNVHRLVDFSLRDESALSGLLRLADHDYYTYSHSVNVGLYGLAIAMAHFGGRFGHNLHEIASALFLHDIGKCRVSSEIINKNGPLDDGEWQEMKKHPGYGQIILERENLLSEEAKIVVAQHHERLDGRGYPRGIDSKEVHPYARICSVADAFDAMTTRRAYRDPFSAFDALRRMKHDLDAQFDSTFFKVFVLQLQQGRRRAAPLHSAL